MYVKNKCTVLLQIKPATLFQSYKSQICSPPKEKNSQSVCVSTSKSSTDHTQNDVIENSRGNSPGTGQLAAATDVSHPSSSSVKIGDNKCISGKLPKFHLKSCTSAEKKLTPDTNTPSARIMPSSSSSFSGGVKETTETVQAKPSEG